MSTPSCSKKKERAPQVSEAGNFSLYAVVAWLFGVEEREALDAKTGGDKSDARYRWGL